MASPGPEVMQLLESSLEDAAKCGKREVVNRLAKAGAPFGDSLHLALLQGHVDIVKDLLELGAFYDVVDTQHSYTPLQLAAAKGTPETSATIIRILLRHGADVELGLRRPLYLAALFGNLGAALALLVGGARSDRHDGPFGETPLHAAVRAGNRDIATALIGSYPGGIKDTDEEERTPLHCAARCYDPGMIRLLLYAGAELDAADSHGRTALHLACSAPLPDVCVALVDGGADVNARDNHDQTPLFHAIHKTGHGVSATVDFLLKSGGDETAVDVFGRRPIDMVNGMMGSGYEERATREGLYLNDFKCVRDLLRNAPGDRRWRRRGFIVLFKHLFDSIPVARAKFEQGGQGVIWADALVFLFEAPKDVFSHVVSFL